MAVPKKLLIFGASTRAAAFSAVRAGLEPWCADLFADADLRKLCAVTQLQPEQYPRGFLHLAHFELNGPWMYTGALENHPRLVQRIARLRPLWGILGEALELCRHPGYWSCLLEQNGIPHPIAWPWEWGKSLSGRWLWKPTHSGGGRGMRSDDETGDVNDVREVASVELRGKVYVQEFIEGAPCAAIYCGVSNGTVLLGVTQQLVGESWLHAVPFQYCGSVGPIALETPVRQAFERLGKVLVAGLKLRGLFGVDCVLRDGVPYPVEINPRYTASVEVLEYATGTSALALHRGVFDSSESHLLALRARKEDIIGKAILFARAPLTFPVDGPWMATQRHPGDIWEMPEFADIPHPGTPIQAGQPILTFFARAATADRCREELQRMAAELDRILFGD